MEEFKRWQNEKEENTRHVAVSGYTRHDIAAEKLTNEMN
jgi:hypothetical protein